MFGIKYIDVYAWAKCPWCAMAITFLKQNGIEFSLTLLDNCPTKRHEMVKETGWMTVPIVIEHKVDGESKLIGGYTDLIAHFKSEYGIDEGEE